MPDPIILAFGVTAKTSDLHYQLRPVYLQWSGLVSGLVGSRSTPVLRAEIGRFGLMISGNTRRS